MNVQNQEETGVILKYLYQLIGVVFWLCGVTVVVGWMAFPYAFPNLDGWQGLVAFVAMVFAGAFASIGSTWVWLGMGFVAMCIAEYTPDKWRPYPQPFCDITTSGNELPQNIVMCSEFVPIYWIVVFFIILVCRR